MAITVEKLKGGYEFFSTMDGYFLTLPNGKTEFFLFYSKLQEYCKENGIPVGVSDNFDSFSN